MARKTRPPEVVDQIKDNIIEESMKLIISSGFSNMSIRKLADRVGMSSTNIYYYYSNKDEIYLNIQIKGFRLLKERFEKIPPSKDPVKTLEEMIRAYLAFGFENPDYYQIMLNSNTPRYLEYKQKNTTIEPVANQAKQMAVKSIAAPLKTISRIALNKGTIPEKDIHFRAYQIWITLHGVVTLNNRNILAEIDEIPSEEIIDRMCEDLLLPFREK